MPLPAGIVAEATMILLGLDPGLRSTGWGLIRASGNRLSHVANGCVRSEPSRSLAERLLMLHRGLKQMIAEYGPDEAAVEEAFVSLNPASTLKLAQARGIALLAPALAGLAVHEYAPNLVKKTVTGSGHAGKQQIRLMVGTLLPGCAISGDDAADALAVAICHAHCAGTAARWGAGGAPARRAS